MNHHEFEDLAPIYALGALDGEDLSRFVAHLAECDRCRTLVREHEEASAALAYSLPPVEPSTSVRESVVAQAARRKFPLGSLAAAAAFVVAVLTAFFALRGESEAQRVARLLGDPQARVIEIRGNEKMPDAFARVVWKGDEVAFVSRGMPALPKGKLYELWAIAEGKPVPLGTYTIDDKGNVVSRGNRLPVPSSVAAFAVSREERFQPVSPTEVVADGPVK